jgi:hypothetical protein
MIVQPWLVLGISANPTSFNVGGNSTITADLTRNNIGEDTYALSGNLHHIRNGEDVTFTTDKGQVGSTTVVKDTTSGKATASLTSTGDTGTANVTATFDSAVNIGTTVNIGSSGVVPTVPGGGGQFPTPFIPTPSTTGGHVISGKVQTSSGSPVPGALVEALVNGISCGSTTTNSSGDYSLTVRSSTEQSGCGFTGSTINFRISGNTITQTLGFISGGFNTNVILTEGGSSTSGYSVSGKVQNTSGTPQGGVTVEALVGTISCGSAQTDSNGNFSLTVRTSNEQSGCGTNGSSVTFRVAGQNVPTTLVFQSGGSNTNVTLTTGGASTPLPGATSTVTPSSVSGDWLDGSPSNPSARQKCPTSAGFELLYWGGDVNAPIRLAAAKCPTARLFWVRRGNSWLGYSAVASGASDEFNIAKGEAAFTSGPNIATPTPTPTPTVFP